MSASSPIEDKGAKEEIEEEIEEVIERKRKSMVVLESKPKKQVRHKGTISSIHKELDACGMQWLQKRVDLRWEDIKAIVWRDLPDVAQLRWWREKSFPGSIRYTAYRRPGCVVPPYQFSRTIVHAKDAPDALMKLFDVAKEITDIKYDLVLVNYYEDIKDGPKISLTVHKDNEMTLDTTVPICSMSFCQTPHIPRRFVVYTQPDSQDCVDKVEVPLMHGDVFVGKLAEYYHGVLPPFKKHSNQNLLNQIALTFRKTKQPLH